MIEARDSSSALPKGWVSAKLGEIAHIGQGGTPNTKRKEYWSGKIPWLRSGEIDFNRITKSRETISEMGLKNSPAKLLPKGTVLLAMTGQGLTRGRAAILEIDAAANQSCAHFILDSHLIKSEYLFYYFWKEYWNIRRLDKGSNQPGLNTSIIKKLAIPLPPLEEQNRMVAKIETLFAESKTAGEALGKVPVLLRRFRQSVLAKAFRGELTQRDLNDEPAQELLERIEQEREKRKQKALVESQEQPSSPDLPGLPETWVWTSLSEVCTKIQDGTHFSPPNFQDLRDGVPYVTAKNIRPNGIDLSQITYVSKSIHEGIYKRCDPVKGDIIYIKDGATTGLAVINELDFPFSMLSSLALLKPDRKIVNGRYVKHYLNSPEAFRRMTGKMTGTAIKRIILKRIKTAEFPLAPLNEQDRMVTLMEEMFALADQVEFAMKRAKERADSINQAILAKALRGKLVPQDPNDEPASVLLERMRVL